MDYANQMTALFLEESVKEFRSYLSRIETCLGKLTAEQIWARGHESENAIGNLLLHLSGNVRQWIIAGVGGAPDTRNRDSEFDARSGSSAAELTARLRGTVEEAIAVIEKLTPERLCEPRKIQVYETNVLAAVYHVVEHFAMHTGQIIFATKMLTGTDLGFYGHLRTRPAEQA